jgi:hypothetical protein
VVSCRIFLSPQFPANQDMLPRRLRLKEEC